MVVEHLSGTEKSESLRGGEVLKLHMEMRHLVDSKIKNTCDQLPSGIKAEAKRILSLDKDFTQRVYTVYENMRGNKPAFFPFFCAYKGYKYLSSTGGTFRYNQKHRSSSKQVKAKLNNYMAVVDYSKGPNSNRFYLIRMPHSSVEAYPAVEHVCTCVSGQGFSQKTGEVGVDTTAYNKNPGGKRIPAQPGENSNTTNSYLSSPGYFYIPGSITGGNTGNHLVVDGIEPGLNDNARNRGIYVHGGSISEGCFVIPKDSLKVLNKLQNGGFIYSHFASANYLRKSQILNKNVISNEKDYLEKSNYLA